MMITKTLTSLAFAIVFGTALGTTAAAGDDILKLPPPAKDELPKQPAPEKASDAPPSRTLDVSAQRNNKGVTDIGVSVPIDDGRVGGAVKITPGGHVGGTVGGSVPIGGGDFRGSIALPPGGGEPSFSFGFSIDL